MTKFPGLVDFIESKELKMEKGIHCGEVKGEKGKNEVCPVHKIPCCHLGKFTNCYESGKQTAIKNENENIKDILEYY